MTSSSSPTSWVYSQATWSGLGSFNSLLDSTFERKKIPRKSSTETKALGQEFSQTQKENEKLFYTLEKFLIGEHANKEEKSVST